MATTNRRTRFFGATRHGKLGKLLLEFKRSFGFPFKWEPEHSPQPSQGSRSPVHIADLLNLDTCIAPEREEIEDGRARDCQAQELDVCLRKGAA